MVGMSFEDLPPNAKDLPLTDRRLAADVIDLIIAEKDRAAGCFGVMVCDEHRRGLQPIVVNEVPADAEAADLASFLDLLLPLVSQKRGSIVVGRGRPVGRRPSDRDREWHQQAIDSCRAHGVPLLGFHLATHDGVFRLPDPLSEDARPA